MQRHRRFSGLFIALIVLSESINPAHAGSDTDQLHVSVTVNSGCSLDGGAMDFGEYLSGQPNDLDVLGQINFVNCSGYMTLSLDGGSNGSVADRYMTLGDHQLKYQLYRSPTRTAIWGEGGDAREVTLLGPPQSRSIDVYGRIPKLQYVPDGLYTDVITVTLTF